MQFFVGKLIEDRADLVMITQVYPYIPEMIKSFNVPTTQIAKYAGLLSLVFSFSQAMVGIAWGRASDKIGRKPMIMIALTCTMVSSILFGFSTNLVVAFIARSMQGLSNGNVGIIRTAVAELVPERELQPRAFSIMPLVWTVRLNYEVLDNRAANESLRSEAFSVLQLVVLWYTPRSDSQRSLVMLNFLRNILLRCRI